MTERIFDLDLNIDLTKFRAYDPAVGRWWQVDPLADEADFTSLTPYNYSFNNPIRYNDPYGDCPCFAIPILYELGVAALEVATAFAGAKTVEAGVNALVENQNVSTTTPPLASAHLDNLHTKLDASTKLPHKKTFKEILEDVKAEKEKAEQKEKQEQQKQQQAQKAKEKAKESQGSAEHTKGARNSTKDKHEKGQARNEAAQKKSNNPNKKKPQQQEGQ